MPVFWLIQIQFTGGLIAKRRIVWTSFISSKWHIFIFLFEPPFSEFSRLDGDPKGGPKTSSKQPIECHRFIEGANSEWEELKPKFLPPSVQWKTFGVNFEYWSYVTKYDVAISESHVLKRFQCVLVHSNAVRFIRCYASQFGQPIFVECLATVFQHLVVGSRAKIALVRCSQTIGDDPPKVEQTMKVVFAEGGESKLKKVEKDCYFSAVWLSRNSIQRCCYHTFVWAQNTRWYSEVLPIEMYGNSIFGGTT